MTWLKAQNVTHLWWQSTDMVFLCCWVRLSENEYVWCVAFKIENTNAYFDLSEVLCPMLFLSESLGPPSGYSQAECWLLAESSLRSWLRHFGETTMTCQIKADAVEGQNIRSLQKAIHSQETFYFLILCWSSRLCIRSWIGCWCNTYLSSGCWHVTASRYCCPGRSMHIKSRYGPQCHPNSNVYSTTLKGTQKIIGSSTQRTLQL